MLKVNQQCLLLVVATLGICSLAQVIPYTPKKGSPERKEIMDALRVPIEKELQNKVIFEVSHLKVQDGWAFLYGVPRQPDGRPMDYKKTPFRAGFEKGEHDDNFCALLRKQSAAWRVVTYGLGSLDVEWGDWHKRYKAPPLIFK